MNKRCIVNVATGDFYCKMQERLKQSFQKMCDEITIFESTDSHRYTSKYYPVGGIDLLLWKDCLPPGSRPHSESPYGFKVHAFKAAYEKGYTSILWLDSPAYAVKEDISPIFDKIEKEGYYAMSHFDPLEYWIGNSALRCFNIGRADLVGLNLPSGTCYGFDINHQNGNALFFAMIGSELTGLFKSEIIEANGLLRHQCWHRHDEAILALHLKNMSLPVFTFDPLFQSDSPECVIKSGGL